MRVWRACAGAATPPTTTTKGISATPESSWRRCLDDSHFTVPADRAAVVGLYGGYVSALGGKIAEADAATYLESSIDGKKAEIAGDRAKKVQFATVDDGASDAKMAKMASMGKALGAAASEPTESASDDNPPESPKSPTATPAAQPASPAPAAADDDGGASDGDAGDAGDAAGIAEGGEAGSAPSPKSPAEPEGEYRGEFSSAGRKARHNYPPIAH